MKIYYKICNSKRDKPTLIYNFYLILKVMWHDYFEQCKTLSVVLMTQGGDTLWFAVTKTADNLLLLTGQFFMGHSAIIILSQLHTTLAVTENEGTLSPQYNEATITKHFLFCPTEWKQGLDEPQVSCQ